MKAAARWRDRNSPANRGITTAHTPRWARECGAEGEARTRTPLRAQRPQRCSSTNSDTSADVYAPFGRISDPRPGRDPDTHLSVLAGAEGLEPPTAGFGDRPLTC